MHNHHISQPHDKQKKYVKHLIAVVLVRALPSDSTFFFSLATTTTSQAASYDVSDKMAVA